MLEPPRGLVPILGHLGEEPHHDAIERLGDLGGEVGRTRRQARNVTVKPLERIAFGGGQAEIHRVAVLRSTSTA